MGGPCAMLTHEKSENSRIRITLRRNEPVLFLVSSFQFLVSRSRHNQTNPWLVLSTRRSALSSTKRTRQCVFLIPKTRIHNAARATTPAPNEPVHAEQEV